MRGPSAICTSCGADDAAACALREAVSARPCCRRREEPNEATYTTLHAAWLRLGCPRQAVAALQQLQEAKDTRHGEDTRHAEGNKRRVMRTITNALKSFRASGDLSGATCSCAALSARRVAASRTGRRWSPKRTALVSTRLVSSRFVVAAGVWSYFLELDAAGMANAVHYTLMARLCDNAAEVGLLLGAMRDAGAPCPMPHAPCPHAPCGDRGAHDDSAAARAAWPPLSVWLGAGAGAGRGRNADVHVDVRVFGALQSVALRLHDEDGSGARLPPPSPRATTAHNRYGIRTPYLGNHRGCTCVRVRVRVC